MNPFHPYPEPKLTVELVPVGQWEDNLRSHLKRSEWDDLRNACYKRADSKCEICGGVGRKHPVECHEIWDYNDETRVQKLTGLIALCPGCHEVKHIGLASMRGRLQVAINRLAKVNEWPIELADEYTLRQFQIHHIRSQMKWSLDLSWLEQSALYISETESIVRERRSERARATLDAMTRTR